MIVYHTQEVIGKAADQYWNHKAIDSIRAFRTGELPQEQFHTIIDKLIANQEIKNILLKQIKEKPLVYETEINQISPLNFYTTTRPRWMCNSRSVLTRSITVEGMPKPPLPTMI